MERHPKLFGHPLHPMLMVFPPSSLTDKSAQWTR